MPHEGGEYPVEEVGPEFAALLSLPEAGEEHKARPVLQGLRLLWREECHTVPIVDSPATQMKIVDGDWVFVWLAETQIILLVNVHINVPVPRLNQEARVMPPYKLLQKFLALALLLCRETNSP